MLNNFSLEEISAEHYDAYKEYHKELLYRNFTMFETHLKEYEQYKKLNNIKGLLNKALLNKDIIPARFREFLLFKKDENKIIGNIDLWLLPLDNQKTVVEFSYTIAEDEQRKGYGKILLLLFLRNNPFDVDSFIARIHPNNKGSMNLIKHFHPTEIGTFNHPHFPEEKLIYFDVPNKAMQKRL